MTIKKLVRHSSWFHFCVSLAMAIILFFNLGVLTVIRAILGAQTNWTHAREIVMEGLMAYSENADAVVSPVYLNSRAILGGYVFALKQLDSDQANHFRAIENVMASGHGRFEAEIMYHGLRLGKGLPDVAEAMNSWRHATDSLLEAYKTESYQEEAANSAVVTANIRLLRLRGLEREIRSREADFNKKLRVIGSKIAHFNFLFIFLCVILTSLHFFRAQNRIYKKLAEGFAACKKFAGEYARVEKISKFAYSSNDDEFADLGRILIRMAHERDDAASELASKDFQLQELQAIIDNFALYTKSDLSGTITHVNEKFLQSTGYSREELIGKNHRILDSDYHPEQFFTSMWNTVFEGRVWSSRMCSKRKDGSLFWSFVTILPNYSSGLLSGFTALRFEISELVKLEEEAAHMARLSQIGQMAGSIAHEINTPLAVLQLYIERCGRENVAFTSEDKTRMLNVVNRISRTIKSILMLTRKSDCLSAPISTTIGSVVEQSAHLGKELCQQDSIEFRTAIASDLIFATHPTELQQVLLNLISNSIKAVKGQSNEEKWIELHASGDNEYVYFRITDSGRGIDPTILRKITTPFFTTANYGESAGLGLSISIQLLSRINGVLSYDETVQNTSFVVRLPIALKMTA